MSAGKRKKFTSGTFLPLFQRFMAIMQLCLAFCLMLAYMLQPCMSASFDLRSHLPLYQYVKETSEIFKNDQKFEKKLIQQIEHFKNLPRIKQSLLKNEYRQLQANAKRPMHWKILEGIRLLIRDISPFEQTWIFLSIAIALLILLKIEKSKRMAWLLPLIGLAYGFNHQPLAKSSLSANAPLFATENKIVHYSLNTPLTLFSVAQKNQLENGWQGYSIENGSSVDYKNQNLSLKDAEFVLTLIHLNLLSQQLPHKTWLNSFYKPSSPFSLCCYLFWNTIFAWTVNQPIKIIKKLKKNHL